MIYAKDNGAPAPKSQGGVAETFNSSAATVRDLEAEGKLPAIASSYGGGALSMTMALIDLQQKNKELRNRLERIEDILAGLIEKQGASL
jgi:hypothetical protein